MAQAESQGGGGAQEIEGEAGKIFSGQPIHSCHKRLVVSTLMTFLHIFKTGSSIKIQNVSDIFFKIFLKNLQIKKIFEKS